MHEGQLLGSHVCSHIQIELLLGKLLGLSNIFVVGMNGDINRCAMEVLGVINETLAPTQVSIHKVECIVDKLLGVPGLIIDLANAIWSSSNQTNTFDSLRVDNVHLS